MSNLSREDLEAKLIAKAWKDDAFRTQLLTDTKAAIESVTGSSLGSVKVEVLEESQNKIYIVLPQAQSSSDELSEDDLEAVAGGSGGTGNWRCAPFTEAGCK